MPPVETTSRSIEYLPLDAIDGTDGNPRTHDLPGVVRSIALLGFTAPAVVDERTGQLIIGNGRLEALRLIRAHQHGEPVPANVEAVLTEARVIAALSDADGTPRPPDGIARDADGGWRAPVVHGWASRDDDHARAAVIADNKLTERGTWDDRALTEWLDGIFDSDVDLLAATGFTATWYSRRRPCR